MAITHTSKSLYHSAIPTLSQIRFTETDVLVMLRLSGQLWPASRDFSQALHCIGVRRSA